MSQTHKKQLPQEAERKYDIRPNLKDRFSKKTTLDIIQTTLENKIKEKMPEKYNHEDAMNLNREICDSIRDQLKDKENCKRYKIFVHCIIGEKRGQGIKIGSKCLWDSFSDRAVSASWENESHKHLLPILIPCPLFSPIIQ